MSRKSLRADARKQGQHRGAASVVLCAALLLGMAGAYRWMLGAAPADPIGGPIVLGATDRSLVTPPRFRGRYRLINFGYTECADVCPETLAQVSLALDRLGAAAARIQPLFVTVDPARDTPARLRAYVAAFSPRLLGLTGSATAIARVERAFHVQTRRQATGAAGQYSIDHSSVLYLMAPDGSLAALLPADAPAAALASDLARLTRP